MASSSPSRPAILDEPGPSASVSHTADAASGWSSGWVTITPGTEVTITHNLGGDPDNYSVQLWFLDEDDGYGINTRGYGGLEWENLTTSTINVYSRVGSPHRVRVRIWERKCVVYLPLILGNCPPLELAYDDGSNDSWQSALTGAGFAVRFITPGPPARLVGARHYLGVASASPIAVHVWNADRNELITPFTVAPPVGTGWFDVNLSAYNLTMSGDFYVGFLSTQDFQPDVGVDTTSPDGRSYKVPWQETSSDYMIRALVVPLD